MGISFWISLISLFVGAAAIVLAYYFYRKSKREKLFGRKIALELLLKPRETIEGLAIKFKETEISHLYRLKLTCWNPGTETILGDDVNAVDPLRLTLPADASTIVPEACSHTHDHVDFNSEVVETSAGAESRLSFSQMEPRDGFALTILIGANKKLSERDVKLLGSIVGVRRVGYIEQTAFTVSKNWTRRHANKIAIAIATPLVVLISSYPNSLPTIANPYIADDIGNLHRFALVIASVVPVLIIMVFLLWAVSAFYDFVVSDDSRFEPPDELKIQ